MASDAPDPPGKPRPLEYRPASPSAYPWWHDVALGLVAAIAFLFIVGGLAAWLLGPD